jgi:hypothetical protein
MSFRPFSSEARPSPANFRDAIYSLDRRYRPESGHIAALALRQSIRPVAIPWVRKCLVVVVLGRGHSFEVAVTSIGRERVRRYGAGRERRFQE